MIRLTALNAATATRSATVRRARRPQPRRAGSLSRMFTNFAVLGLAAFGGVALMLVAG